MSRVDSGQSSSLSDLFYCSITGWIMTAALIIMIIFAAEKRRRAKFERFWYSHHLFILFFFMWQIHGMFCEFRPQAAAGRGAIPMLGFAGMIQPDRPPYCSPGQIGVFWVSANNWTIYARDDLTDAALPRNSGFPAVSSTSRSESCEKFELATRHTSRKSFSTHPRCARFRSKRSTRIGELGSTYF